MAKIRRNHSPKKDNMVLRVGLFAAILVGLVGLFNFFGADVPESDEVSDKIITPSDTVDDRSFYLPSYRGELVHHDYYSLSYREECELSEWIAYILTRGRLDEAKRDRVDRYRPDTAISTGSAQLSDYRDSGYDRGHLVPAADMAFAKNAMGETFLMSNIAPQARDFNTGIWRELEEQVRTWARTNKKLYVVSGPVLEEKSRIGDNEVLVPRAYYKVLLDAAQPQRKGLAFIIPNQVSYKPLFDYAVSIDVVERRTGLDFFPNLLTDALEDELESDYNLDLWPFNKQFHDQRMEQQRKE